MESGLGPALADLSVKATDAAELLKALSSEHRLLVLCHLAAEGELTAGALVERAGISQSALSQHLKKLREQGLVAYRRDAQTLHYRIADPRAERLLGVLQDIFCPELAGTTEQSGSRQPAGSDSQTPTDIQDR